jgi:hypothetical protein
MDRRILLLTTGVILLGVRSSSAQEILGIKVPDLKEFTDVIVDEARLQSIISGVWVLRDILLLDAKPDSPNEGAAELDDISRRVRSMREIVIKAASENEKLLELPSDVKASIEKIGGTLQKLGVQGGSEVFIYLIRSYITFNQAAATLGFSLCSIFPFRIWCSS